jgi:uncharacterized membrane protein (UPF0127 family)
MKQNIKIVVFRTPKDQELGLQYMTSIPDNTVYIFMSPSTFGQFQSRNVPEPFDIAFLSAKMQLNWKHRMVPPDDVVQIPKGTRFAVEAKVGVFDKFSFKSLDLGR